MGPIILTSISGWVVALLLPLTIAIPLRHSRVQRAILPALRPHFWLGYGIAVLAIAHAGIAAGLGVALRANATGVYLATGALLLVFLQLFLGLLLREPSLRRRPVVRRRHVWVMVGIVLLALGHIALNSALLHSIFL